MGKTKAFQQTFWELQRRFGQRGLGTASDLAELMGISTGIAHLDALLKTGGIAHRRITEIIGVPTSGVTTLAHRIVANAQMDETTAAYIDLDGTLDPDYAVRCGVDLERLLIVRPRKMAKALEIVHDMLRDNGPSLVVLDSISQNVLAQVGAVRRLSDAVIRSRTAVLILTASQGGNAAEPFLHTRLHLERAGWTQNIHDITGYQVCITLLKDKGGTGEGRTVIAEIPLQTGLEGGGAE